MAGLLDLINDGQGGGILGSLLSAFQQPQSFDPSNPYDPRNAFGQMSAAGAPGSMPPQPTMPVYNQGQFNPMDAQAAAPGTMPQPMSQTAAPTAPAPGSPLGGIGDHLMAGLRSMGQAPTLGGALLGLGSGLITGHDPQTDQRQRTAEALQKAFPNVPPDRLAALASQPELLRAWLPTQFQAPTANERDYVHSQSDPQYLKFLDRNEKDFKPTFGVTGEDQDGNKTYGWIDPNNKNVTPYTPPQPANSSSGATDPSVTGDEFLKSINPADARTVKALADYRITLPTGMALKSPYWQKMLQLTTQYDPSFDAPNYRARASSMQDFASGKSSEMVRAANQTIHHVGALVDSMDKLNNGSFPALNAVGNFVSTQTGKGAVTEFLPNAHAVAEEMSKVFKGANLSDAEVRQWERSLHENMSPEQQRASVGKLLTLLNGSLSALEEKRAAGVGAGAAGRMGPLLKEESQKTLGKVSKWMAGDVPPSATTITSASPPQDLKTYATPAAVQDAIRTGERKSGDYFMDANGKLRRVP